MTSAPEPSLDDVERIARGLTKAQRDAVVRTEGEHLLQSQSDRGSLTGILTDYSFRPARLTPLGLAVRQHLISQDEQEKR